MQIPAQTTPTYWELKIRFPLLKMKFLEKLKPFESDTSNPDVGKTFAHTDDVEVLSLSLDNADGWIELVNYSEANKKDIVINSAARSGEAVEKFGGTLIGSLDELNRQLVSFWVINRQRDSIELLKKYMDIVPGELHVVRNTFYGEPQKFELFNGSKTKIEAEKRGATIDLPDLADRVTDKALTSKLLTSPLPLGMGRLSAFRISAS